MKLRIFCALLIMFALSFSCLMAQTPKSLNEIELFPGSKPDSERLKFEKETFDEIFSDSTNIKDKDIRVFFTDQPVNVVVDWYAKKLKAVDNDKLDYNKIGNHPLVTYSAIYYDEDDFKMEYEGKMLTYDGKWVKKCLENRPKSPNGKVMLNASFMMESRSDNDDRFEINVVVEDMGFDFENKKYKQKTAIKYTSCHFSSPELDADNYDFNDSDDSDEDLSEIEDNYDGNI